MDEKTFTPDNFNELKQICQKIIFLCNENVDGKLQHIQLLFLADNIKDFKETPIVKNSGIL